jgi:hypothetical protein
MGVVRKCGCHLTQAGYARAFRATNAELRAMDEAAACGGCAYSAGIPPLPDVRPGKVAIVGAVLQLGLQNLPPAGHKVNYYRLKAGSLECD